MRKYESKQLAGSLQAWVGKKGQSLRWLAQETGISYNVVLRYGRGDVCPTLRSCVLMADALGISLDQLYQGPEDPKERDEELKKARKQLEKAQTQLWGAMENLQRLLGRMAREDAEV